MKFMVLILLIVSFIFFLACGSDNPVDPYKNLNTNTVEIDSPVVSGVSPINTGLPTWTWLPVTGATVYRVGFSVHDWINESLTEGTYTPDETHQLGEGTYTLLVQAGNGKGSWSQSGRFTVIVDMTPPAVPIVDGTAATNSRQPVFSWSDESATGAVKYRYGVEEGTWVSEAITDTEIKYATELIDGTYVLYVQSGDDAGNWSESDTFNFAVDNTAPAAPVIAAVSPTNEPTPQWSWSDESVSGATKYRYGHSETDWIVENTTDLYYTPVSELNDGLYTLYVQAGDDLGNWSPVSFFEIIVDTTIPDMPVVNGIVLTTDNTPDWTWSDESASGAISYRYGYHDGKWITEGVTALNYTPADPISDGTYTLYVQACNQINTCSASGTFVTKIDTIAPTPPTVSGAATTNLLTPSWDWTEVATGVLYRYGFTEGTWITETTGSDYKPSQNLAAGSHTLYVQAADEAGNWSTSGTFTTLIETTAPTVEAIQSPLDAATGVSPSLALTIKFSEPILEQGTITLTSPAFTLDSTNSLMSADAVDPSIVTITTTLSLAGLTSYTGITISGFKDYASNVMAASYTDAAYDFLTLTYRKNVANTINIYESYPDYGSYFTDLAVEGSNVYIVFADDVNDDYYLVISNDGGDTWGTPEKIVDLNYLYSYCTHVSLSVKNGVVYLVYSDYNVTNNLIFLKWVGPSPGTITTTNIGTTAYAPTGGDMLLTSNGFYVAYHYNADDSLKIAYSADGVDWTNNQTIHDVASYRTGYYPAITSAGDSVYISYKYEWGASPLDYDLMLATIPNSNIIDKTITAITDPANDTYKIHEADPSNNQSTGSYSSIYVNGSTIVIAYRNDSTYNLEVVKSINGGSTWTRYINDTTVASHSDGYFPNVTVSGNNICVTFADLNQVAWPYYYSYKSFVTKDGGSNWSEYTIDNVGDVGGWSKSILVNNVIYSVYVSIDKNASAPDTIKFTKSLDYGVNWP